MVMCLSVPSAALHSTFEHSKGFLRTRRQLRALYDVGCRDCADFSPGKQDRGVPGIGGPPDVGQRGHQKTRRANVKWMDQTHAHQRPHTRTRVGWERVRRQAITVWTLLSSVSVTTLLVSGSIFLALIGCALVYCGRRPRGPDGQPADLHTYEMVEVNDDSDEDDFEIDDDDEHTMAADGAKEVSAWSAEISQLDEEYGCTLDEENWEDFATGRLEGVNASDNDFSGRSGHGVEAL